MKIVLTFKTLDVVEDAMNEHHCDEMPAPEIVVIFVVTLKY